MRSHSILLSILLLAAAFMTPAEFSFSQTNQTSTATNQTSTAPDTQTSTEIENLGQEVSSYVQQAMSAFKMQRAETLDVIKDCRENIVSASVEDRDSIRQDCRAKLNDIRDSYKESRMDFRELFKEHRNAMKMAIND